ncbi:MAG: HTH domain-containing protein [Desulforhopalus sp.]
MGKQNTASVVIEALSLLISLNDTPSATRQNLAKQHSRSKATVTRNINLLRSLGVKVEWSVERREYDILDWGIFDLYAVEAFLSSRRPKG